MQSIQAIYQPLDERRSEIRLIEILSSDEKIQCRLSISSLKDNPEFTALSYVWGDPKVTEDIILNDELFPVTTNLGAALRYVKGHWCSTFPNRSPGLFRLWVDAICINQKDKSERSSQVNLMREIYSKTELVFSWLGHGIEELDVAIEAVKIIAKETKELGYKKADVKWLKSYPSWCAEPEEAGDKPPWDAIKSFCLLPYWRRVWIFPELVLGKDILFLHGSTALTYGDLDRARGWLSSIRNSIDSGRIEEQSFLGHHTWFMLRNPSIDITPFVKVNIYKARGLPDPWSIFYLSSTLQATDPRDHVYGFLGLRDFGIVPDYRKDLCSVSHDLVNTWMKDTNRLDCLLYAGVGTYDRGSYESLPSWAPNFPFASQQLVGTGFFNKGHADQGVFLTTIKAPSLIDSALHISGVLGPAVVKVNEAISVHRWEDGRMYEFARDFVRRAPSNANGIHPLKAIFEVLKSLVFENEITPRVSEESLVRLAISFLLSLQPQGDLKLALQELGLPIDDKFPDKFFNTFFPALRSEKNGFLDKFWSVEYCKREMLKMLVANGSIQFYFRFTEMEGGYR